jgi:SAM-dependent methyltransferase
MNSSYYCTPWLEQIRQSSTHPLKRGIYAVVRPLLSAVNRRHLSAESIRSFRPQLVLAERGMPRKARLRWASRGHAVDGKVILVQGTGTGWDVVGWAARRPARIIASDLFSFSESWDEIRRYCAERYGVDVSFHSANLAQHAFLGDGTVDLCVSDAVYEHCQALPDVVRETFRILKPGGIVYASYGPMWFCAGGDHYSGRGGLEHVYSHLLLDKASYQRYLEEHCQDAENRQGGYRYAQLGLFSGLTTREYLSAFREAGFQMDGLILEVSRDARRFRSRFPDVFAGLLDRYAPRCTADDFVIKTNLVRLVKPASR